MALNIVVAFVAGFGLTSVYPNSRKTSGFSPRI